MSTTLPQRGAMSIQDFRQWASIGRTWLASLPARHVAPSDLA